MSVIINLQTARDAYQLAVAEGFEGTREEWLASLQGQPGTDATVTANAVAGVVSGSSSKSNPANNDLFAIVDSEAADEEEQPTLPLKKLTWGNIKASLQSHFDPIYSATGHTHLYSEITGKPTSLAGYGITDAVSTSMLSTSGGANKVPQFDSNADLTLGSLNNVSLGLGGNLIIPPFRELKFVTSAGAGSSYSSIYMWPAHSGGNEMIIDSPRICFYWSGGMQFGSPASLRDGRHIYIQPGAATAGDTIKESPPVALSSSYWNGTANVGQNTWFQVVPSSAAADTEVLNINFGGTVGSDHRITGGVTPVKFNRTGILAAGTIQGGVWNGMAIADSYIASAATWNAKQPAPTFGILANNQTISGTTTYADVTGCSITLQPGTYVIDANLTTTQANGTMGSKVQMVASGTGIVNTGWTKLTANGISHQPEFAINYGNLSWSEGRTITSAQPCLYSAKMVVTVSSGTATLKLQAAQATSDAGNLTVLSGAMIRAEKIA